MFDGADGAGPDNLVPLKHDELKILLTVRLLPNGQSMYFAMSHIR